MILCNVDIQRAIDDGDLVIAPEPLPRAPSLANPDCPYDTTAVNLRLGRHLSIPRKGLAITFDPHRGMMGPTLSTAYETIELGTGGYTLDPQRFILGKTKERVALPVRAGKAPLAARIEGRSSFARCGLLVHFTAPTIHAGFDGTITLEIMNLGAFSITLREDCQIAQLIVERVSGEPFANPSEFQNQSLPTGVVAARS